MPGYSYIKINEDTSFAGLPELKHVLTPRTTGFEVSEIAVRACCVKFMIRVSFRKYSKVCCKSVRIFYLCRYTDQ